MIHLVVVDHGGSQPRVMDYNLGVVDHDLGVADHSGSCLGVMDHDLGVVDHDLEVVDHGESQWIMTQG